MNNQDNLDTAKYVGKNISILIKFIICLILAGLMLVILHLMRVQEERTKELNDRIVQMQAYQATASVQKDDVEPIVIVVKPVLYQMQPEPQPSLEEDVFEGREYLEQCVEAEAGNQGVVGKAYVCDVILNRLNWDDYNTIYDVINDRGQFQCVSNGNIRRVKVSDETKYVVSSELKNKLDDSITYFRTNQYHSGTEPCFQYGAHYFSKEK